VCYTTSKAQEADCNDCLDMRVVRDGVFQTVVSVAYSEGKVVRLKMAQSDNSGKLSVRISPVLGMTSLIAGLALRRDPRWRRHWRIVTLAWCRIPAVRCKLTHLHHVRRRWERGMHIIRSYAVLAERIH